MSQILTSTGFIHFIKFNIVGIINTIFGYSIVFGTMYFLNFDAKISNALGYILGVLLSYYLNRKYTFKSEARVKNEILKFFGVFIIAYTFNFLTLVLSIEYLHINEYISQVISAVVYTVTFFILSKFFVFKS